MTDKVSVACTIPNGYELCLYKTGHDDGAGYRHRVRDGDPVVIGGPNSIGHGAHATAGRAPVVTDVPRDFMLTWLEQNENHPFVRSGSILIVADSKKDEDAPIVSETTPARREEVYEDGEAKGPEAPEESTENPT